MTVTEINRILFEIDPFGTLCHWFYPDTLDEYESEAKDVMMCMLHGRYSLIDAIDIVLASWDEDFLGLTVDQKDIIINMME